MNQPDPTETARALLYRHGLPEDVLDGALCLHAQELAALQRLRMDELDLTGQKARIVGRIVDLIDPTRTAPAGRVAAVTRTEQTEAYRLALSEALGLGNGANWEAIRDRARDLVAEVGELTAATRRLGLTVSEYGQGASALSDKLRAVRRVADGLERDAAAPGVVEIVRPALRDAARQIRATLAAPVVPPAPTSRAVLLRAADRILAEIATAGQYAAGDIRLPGLRAAVDGLRAMADCPACEAGIDHDVHCPSPESHNWGCGCPSDVAAAIASCPGREVDGPSPCRCPCEGCKHHCAAHDPSGLAAVPAAAEEQPESETPEGAICKCPGWCGHKAAPTKEA